MNELQQLEQLLQELLGGIQDVLQSGEILSDEFQGLLAQELEYLTTRIDELRAAETPPIPPLDKAMPSSVINSFAYDPKSNRMFVRFKGKWPNAEGPIYSYDGVPPVIFNIFKKGAVSAKTKGSNKWGKWWEGKNPSMGASMNVLLKEAGFPYHKLTS